MSGRSLNYGQDNRTYSLPTQGKQVPTTLQQAPIPNLPNYGKPRTPTRRPRPTLSSSFRERQPRPTSRPAPRRFARRSFVPQPNMYRMTPLSVLFGGRQAPIQRPFSFPGGYR